MRILLVTNKSNNHKYWVAELYSKFNVVGVFHPIAMPNRKLLFKQLKSKNFVFFLLKVASFFYHKFSKNSFTKKLLKYQNEFFNESIKLYDKIPVDLIYTVDSINSNQSIKKAKELRPDVVCFLGGDIVKKEFLSIPNITTLNFHSGVSPFYNGSGTTFSAVADSRPNFCGGTLMIMNERIDGGDILAHYLTPIEEQDNSSTLFLKGIKGAVKLYCSVLNHIKMTNETPEGFRQERSVKYCISSDWTLYEDFKLNSFEKSKRMKRYIRREKVITFFDKSISSEHPLHLETLKHILKKKGE